MALPLKYNFANVTVRWRATVATVLGIALTVAVFVLVQALAEGIKKSGASTGDPRNVLVVRKGSTAESSSLVSREQLRAFQYYDEIARNERGEPIISADIIVLANLPRKPAQVTRGFFMRWVVRILVMLRLRQPDGPLAAGEANVLFRGVTARGVELRPQVKLVPGVDAKGQPVESRWFTPGQREIVVSARLAQRFANFHIGGSFKSGPATFYVVGWFDGGGSAYDSECWLDADEARAIFDRDSYSSLLLRPRDEASRSNLVARIEGDKRFQLRAEPETEYYRKQTNTAKPIQWLGSFLAVAMSVGAVFAAMNTMYAAVGARTREVGTLRVLGFRRRTVLVSFLIEGALLAFLGGLIGCAISLPMNGVTTSTISFETFSESVFAFTITPMLIGKGLVFAVLVGIVGTFLPALRASRLPVIAALKSL